MKYSTKYDYQPDILEEVANFCAYWDQKQKRLSKRIEKILTDERNLYLQYMFINHASSPLSPSKELIERWLAPSKAYEIYNLRIEILNRLFEYTQNNVFDYPKSKIVFPNIRELIFWRKYHHSIYNETRKLFRNISTEDIVKSELALWPFYDSMTIYNSKKNDQSLDFFLESHAEVSDILAEPTQVRQEEADARVDVQEQVLPERDVAERRDRVY
jgi:hypothetical protein